jgi:ATP sulfurylase
LLHEYYLAGRTLLATFPGACAQPGKAIHRALVRKNSGCT